MMEDYKHSVIDLTGYTVVVIGASFGIGVGIARD
jgi:NAD(P)-dependent dehydrogenase (short-subunit alcohol dehydrogenase family)